MKGGVGEGWEWVELRKGGQLARQEIVTLVRTFDKNSDGKVSIEEFFGAFGKAYTEA